MASSYSEVGSTCNIANKRYNIHVQDFDSMVGGNGMLGSMKDTSASSPPKLDLSMDFIRRRSLRVTRPIATAENIIRTIPAIVPMGRGDTPAALGLETLGVGVDILGGPDASSPSS